MPRQVEVGRIRNWLKRSEAWRRYAFRQMDRAEEMHARWQDAEAYGIRAESEIRNETIREMERDAREEARGAYAEGYQRGREDGDDRW